MTSTLVVECNKTMHSVNNQFFDELRYCVYTCYLYTLVLFFVFCIPRTPRVPGLVVFSFVLILQKMYTFVWP